MEFCKPGLRVLDRHQLLAVAEFHRALDIHAGEFGGGPGDGEESHQCAGAAHGLGAEPVGFADDHGEKGRGHVGADVEQAGAVADQRGPFYLRPDHDAGAIDQAQHRDVEGVAELQEPSTLVGAVGIDCARQMMRVVGDRAHRPSFHADESGNDAHPEFLADFQDRSGVGDGVDNLSHVV